MGAMLWAPLRAPLDAGLELAVFPDPLGLEPRCFPHGAVASSCRPKRGSLAVFPGDCYGAGPSAKETTRMKVTLIIGGLTLLLVACSPSDACRSHKDEASCTADNACQWKADKKKNKCKMAKKGKQSPLSEKTTAPASSEPDVPTPSVKPDDNYRSPSTDTQPQPVYPGDTP